MTDYHSVARYAEALACISGVYRALDASDAEGVSAHFTKEAVWHRPDGTLTGRIEIETMVRARAAERTTAHLVSNLVLDAHEKGWIASYYLTVFAGTDCKGAFAGILLCEDELSETDEGLRVKSKHSTPLLRPDMS